MFVIYCNKKFLIINIGIWDQVGEVLFYSLLDCLYFEFDKFF